MCQATAVNASPPFPSRLTAIFADRLSSARKLPEQLIADLESNRHVVTADQRVEICAVVWACVEASLEAHALSAEDRDVLAPPLLAALIPGWKTYCSESSDSVAAVTHRAAYYLADCNTAEPFSTARNIAHCLLRTLGDDEPASSTACRSMSSLLVNQMLEY